MQNIDKKVTLILKLNNRLKSKGLLLQNKELASKIPALKDNANSIQKSLVQLSIIENVLINTNYLNY
jgi:hypothetical protein